MSALLFFGSEAATDLVDKDKKDPQTKQASPDNKPADQTQAGQTGQTQQVAQTGKAGAGGQTDTQASQTNQAGQTPQAMSQVPQQTSQTAKANQGSQTDQAGQTQTTGQGNQFQQDKPAQSGQTAPQQTGQTSQTTQTSQASDKSLVGRVQQLDNLQIDKVAQAHKNGEEHVPNTDDMEGSSADLEELQFANECLAETISALHTVRRFQQAAQSSVNRRGMKPADVAIAMKVVNDIADKQGIARPIILARESHGYVDNVANALMVSESLSGFIGKLTEQAQTFLHKAGQFFSHAYEAVISTINGNERRFKRLKDNIDRQQKAISGSTLKFRKDATFKMASHIPFILADGVYKPGEALKNLDEMLGTILPWQTSEARSFYSHVNEQIDAITKGTAVAPQYLEYNITRNALKFDKTLSHSFANHDPAIEVDSYRAPSGSMPGNCIVVGFMPTVKARAPELAKSMKNCRITAELDPLFAGHTPPHALAFSENLSDYTSALPLLESISARIKATRAEITQLQSLRQQTEKKIKDATARLTESNAMEYLQSLLSWFEGIERLFMVGALALVEYSNRVLNANLEYMDDALSLAN